MTDENQAAIDVDLANLEKALDNPEPPSISETLDMVKAAENKDIAHILAMLFNTAMEANWRIHGKRGFDHNDVTRIHRIAHALLKPSDVHGIKEARANGRKQ